jgi:chromosome segregation ATPase
MQNIFKYIFLPLLIIYTIYLIWKTYFGDPKELEKINEGLKEKNKNIQKTRDSLDIVNQKLSIKFDSVMDIRKNLTESIQKLKNDYEVLERKSQRNLDSLNKWKNYHQSNKKKIEEIKKNRKNSTNQETLDFFKKY